MALLLSAGDHVPVIPFSEVVGSGDRIPPEQIEATGLNVGVVLIPAIETVIPDVAVHPLASLTVIVYGPDARLKKMLLD